MQPGEAREIYACVGTKDAAFPPETLAECRNEYRKKTAAYGKTAGKEFELSVKLMKAALLLPMWYIPFRDMENLWCTIRRESDGTACIHGIPVLLDLGLWNILQSWQNM
ncbi:MAG: hypothetical protein ACLRPV_02365 [Lacrimispora saccharolytica]